MTTAYCSDADSADRIGAHASTPVESSLVEVGIARTDVARMTDDERGGWCCETCPAEGMDDYEFGSHLQRVHGLFPGMRLRDIVRAELYLDEEAAAEAQATADALRGNGAEK